MYCPKCSQQQISDDARFCSRCGFPLGPIAQMLAGGEIIIVRDKEPRRKISLRNIQGPSRIGAKMLFFSIVLLPIAIGLSVVFDAPGPLLIPFLLFFLGLSQVIYVRIFGDSALPGKRHIPPVIHAAQEQRFNTPLPPAAPMPMINNRPTNTSEIVQPPSVTERTTTLLEKK